MNQLSIKEFYSGKSVFITGATGFIGKTLVEKLLWSCPGIENIFIIVRSKKGKNVQERVEEVTNSPCFDRIRAAHPEYLKKIIALEGDITMENLGMSPEDLERFYEKVNVIFHSAASIRMDESVKDAINNNTLPTKRLIAMGKKVKNLEAFVHVSTAYSNYFQPNTKEVAYLPPFDPNDMLKMVEAMPTSIQSKVEPALLDCMNGPRLFPNTYTFSKNLAEALVHLEAEGIPRAIVRPSIVIAAYNEPTKGWIDNWGGSTERLFQTSIGSIHHIEANPNSNFDLVPVDFVRKTVNLVIAAGYRAAVERPKEVQVYSAATSAANELIFHKFWGYVQESARKYPYNHLMWWPSLILWNDKFSRKFVPFLLHKVPAYIFDLLLVIQGKKPKMVKMEQKLIHNYRQVKPFVNTPSLFDNSNTQKFAQSLSPSDQKEFPFDMKLINWRQMADSYVFGVKKYLMKEDCSEEALKKGLKKMQRLKVIHYVIKYFFLGSLLLLAYSIFNVFFRNFNTVLK